ARGQGTAGVMPTRSWRRYLRFWRADHAADIDEELRFHLESRVADYVADGLSGDDARAAAFARFGDVGSVTSALQNLTQHRQLSMQRRQGLDIVMRDLIFGARQLARNPGFTVVAVLTLALAIGA